MQETDAKMERQSDKNVSQQQMGKWTETLAITIGTIIHNKETTR